MEVYGMLYKGIIKKQISFGFILLLILSLVLVGCGKRSRNVDIDVDVNPEQNEQQQTTNNNPDNVQTNNPPLDNNNPPSNSPLDSNVRFVNVELDESKGELPLQRTEGIFYFTRNAHPPIMEQSFNFDTHNGWLIQLHDPKYMGQKLEVQKITRFSGNKYEITVRLKPGGDPKKPAYGFFQVGIYDMPTYSQFRVVTDLGQRLWPKY